MDSLLLPSIVLQSSNGRNAKPASHNNAPQGGQQWVEALRLQPQLH
jgi:hypothetical protein